MKALFLLLLVGLLAGCAHDQTACARAVLRTDEETRKYSESDFKFIGPTTKIGEVKERLGPCADIAYSVGYGFLMFPKSFGPDSYNVDYEEERITKVTHGNKILFEQPR